MIRQHIQKQQKNVGLQMSWVQLDTVAIIASNLDVFFNLPSSDCQDCTRNIARGTMCLQTNGCVIYCLLIDAISSVWNRILIVGPTKKNPFK